MNIQEMLLSMQDISYKSFQQSLMPTVDSKTVIGVRTPEIKALAKKLIATETANSFMRILPHKYYEENNLHALLVSELTDYNSCISELNVFLPYINNWATCDSLRPKCFKANKKFLISDIKRWLSSTHTYTVRFGIEMLMVHFLDDDFKPEYLKIVAEIKSNDYYLQMMQAWFFATALAKQYVEALPYIEKHLLCTSVHNKTIQKAIESHLITKEQKEKLKELKRKKM